jgi:single-strand DNA-binding protein
MNELINSCRFIGSLGQDPEGRFTPKGTPLTKFSIAVDNAPIKKDGKTEKKDPTWVPITAWNELATFCNDYLRKGSLIAVDCELSYNTYEKDGIKHTVANFTARSVKPLARWGKDNGNSPEGDTVSNSRGSKPVVTDLDTDDDGLPF